MPFLNQIVLFRKNFSIINMRFAKFHTACCVTEAPACFGEVAPRKYAAFIGSNGTTGAGSSPLSAFWLKWIILSHHKKTLH